MRRLSVRIWIKIPTVRLRGPSPRALDWARAARELALLWETDHYA